MSWTDERIEALKAMWEAGQTASQIAEALGGVSRNAVIGKAHRLELQARPSPVTRLVEHPVAEAQPAASTEFESSMISEETTVPELEAATPWSATNEPATNEAAVGEPAVDELVADGPADEPDAPETQEADAPAAAAPRAAPVLRSVGPGGFVRQSPGEQQPPIAPAPPRRLVPAKPSPDIAGKTSLLDLSDKICKWPLGHPGEPDFHFCGDKVNPGFPYCIAHCGHAYQAQLPRRDRRPPPPLPFGGPRPR